MALNKPPKVLVLLSGGLDSTLALKIMLDQNVLVEAVNFASPFSQCDECAVDSIAESFGVKIHRVSLGQEFLDLIMDPPHGHGSQMNPCIDCRILILKKSSKIAESIDASCIVTGEVLNERPFSQRKSAMLLIEREAGLDGRILRPLSAKLLPETEFEKKKRVDRNVLFSIKGRRRLPQIQLAEKLNIKDYPNPSGGCLLTDPLFAKKLRDFLEFNDNLTLRDIPLLKIGRHFRMNNCKIVVGRNEEENIKLISIATIHKLLHLEVADYMGPITVLKGETTRDVIQKAAEMTVRYSDAPKEVEVRVNYNKEKTEFLVARAAEDKEIEGLRVGSTTLHKPQKK